MNAPERLYLNPKHDRRDTPDKNLYNAWTDRQDDGDIPYRRERECVWVRWHGGDTREGRAFKTGCETFFFVAGSVPGEDDYLHCPRCGGTIRIEEDI